MHRSLLVPHFHSVVPIFDAPWGTGYPTLHNPNANTGDTALLAANALVDSLFDYCNSLFRSLSALDLHRLQCVQNSLARIVANITKYSNITPVRKSLHWLSACFTLFSRWPIGVQVSTKWLYQNTLNLSSNPDIVCTELVEVNLMACC